MNALARALAAFAISILAAMLYVHADRYGDTRQGVAMIVVLFGLLGWIAWEGRSR